MSDKDYSIQVDDITVQEEEEEEEEEESSKWKDAATTVFWGILAVPLCICFIVMIFVVCAIMVLFAWWIGPENMFILTNL